MHLHCISELPSLPSDTKAGSNCVPHRKSNSLQLKPNGYFAKRSTSTLDTQKEYHQGSKVSVLAKKRRTIEKLFCLIVVRVHEMIHGNKDKSREKGQLRLEKFPVYLLNVLLWIPPQCALKNRMMLIIIMTFHAMVLIFWLGSNCLFFYAIYQSKIYIILPKIYIFLISSYNVLLLSHKWLFLYKVWNAKKQLNFNNTLENICGVWLPKHKILLVLFFLSACVQIALMTLVEVHLWSGELVYHVFSSLGEFFPKQAFSVIYVPLRIYQLLSVFLYPLYFASLCLKIYSLSDQSFFRTCINSTMKIDQVGKELCKIVKLISLVNARFQTNNSLFLAHTFASVMIWLYFGIVFRECYSYWIFTQVGCFATTLASFLWISSTIHTKVRVIDRYHGSLLHTRYHDAFKFYQPSPDTLKLFYRFVKFLDI